MKKEPFVTKAQLDEIVKEFPTPFHLYDERGIRENVKALKEAFSWNPGYKEYFAVKATPNPFLIDILKEYGCGCDCSSYTELLLSDAVGIAGRILCFPPMILLQKSLFWRINWGQLSIWTILHILSFWSRRSGIFPRCHLPL